jgi:amino acid transporter
MLISIIAILGLPLDILIESEAPLRDLVIRDNPQAGDWIGVISLFAIVNGILIQIIMASRILYGMAVQKRAPSLFSEVSSLTLTPWFSTIFITLTVLVAALWFPLVVLAKATSFGILIIFMLINTTLWILFRRGRCRVRWLCNKLTLGGSALVRGFTRFSDCIGHGLAGSR